MPNLFVSHGCAGGTARRARTAATGFVLIALFVCSGFASRAQNAQNHRARQFPPGTVKATEDLPPSKLRTRLERLPDGPRDRALQRLKSFHFTELDLESLDVDEDGGVLYVDHFSLDPDVPEEPSTPVTAEAAVPVSPFPSSLAFHSRPGSPNVIFLNFAGETVSGTAWNNSVGRSVIPATAFSADGDYSTFSDAEQLAIKRIWQRVAEDFASFDVDVTTERPTTFGTRTAQALITRSTDANGAANPSSTAGGVAYISSFATSSFAQYRPAWVYYDNLSGSESYIAEAASHEIGHNLGLSHDGKTDGSSYYGGHGSGETSWGPLMGTGYGRNVSQWSQGGYYLANNTQDDLAIIAAKIPYRSDDHGDTPQTATPLVFNNGTNIVSTTPETDPTNLNPANKGVIGRNSDVDVFSFTTGSGNIRLNVNPWINAAGTRGGNLDISIELRNAVGSTIASNNSASATAAQIQTSVAAGTYHLFVRNTGVGDPLSANPSGYASYGSIGQYFVSGNIAPTASLPALVQLTTTVNNPAWGSIAPSSGSFAIGTPVQLVATPATYYRFVAWTNSASGTNASLTLTLQSNLTVGAIFAERFTTNHPTPHWWLASLGYTFNFESAANLLGANGIPLWQSYLAGLNPSVPSSQLRLSITRNAANSTNLLTWNPVAGRTYTLWSRTNWTQPFTMVAGASNLAPHVAQFAHRASSSPTFYRLEVRMP